MNTAQRHRLKNLLLLAVAAGLLLLFRDSVSASQIHQWVNTAGIWAPLMFILVFIVGAVLVLPSSLFMLAAGALFGPVLGSLYSVIGASLSALLTFLITRYLLAERIRTSTGAWSDRIISGVEKEGWRFVAFTRLVPIFPFNLVSYAFGLTHIKTLPYLIATSVFIIPGSVLFTYLGHTGFTTLTGVQNQLPHSLISLAAILVVFVLGCRWYHKRHQQETACPVSPVIKQNRL